MEFDALKIALIEHLKTLNYSFLDKKSKAYNLVKEVLNSEFVILDFNYTKSTEKILKDFGLTDDVIEKRLIKIHGSVDTDIVFGVEDHADILSEHTFLKKSSNIIFKGINIYRQLPSLSNLFIFGHSLGETDHTYFRSFFNSFASEGYEDGDKQITLYHYDETGKNQLFQQLNVLTNNKVTLLRQNSQFDLIDTSV